MHRLGQQSQQVLAVWLSATRAITSPATSMHHKAHTNVVLSISLRVSACDAQLWRFDFRGNARRFSQELERTAIARERKKTTHRSYSSTEQPTISQMSRTGHGLATRVVHNRGRSPECEESTIANVLRLGSRCLCSCARLRFNVAPFRREQRLQRPG